MAFEPNEDNLELLQEFIMESLDMVQEAEEMLLELESLAEEEGPEFRDALDGIFRLFHSIKGASGFLGLGLLTQVTHEAESYMDLFRSGVGSLNPESIDLLCLTVDLIKEILGVVARDHSDEPCAGEASSMTTRLRAAISELVGSDEVAAPAPLPAPESTAFEVDEVDQAEPKAAPTPEPPPTQAMPEPPPTEIAAPEPAGQEEEGVVFFGAPKAKAPPAQAKPQIEEEGGVVFFGAPKAPPAHRHEPATLPNTEPPTVLAAPEQRFTAQVTVETPRIVLPLAEQSEAEAKIPRKPESVTPKASESSRKSNDRVTDVTARVALEKLDSLMNLVGELIIAEAAVTHNTDLQGLHLESFQKSAMHLNRITRSLQDVAMSMRMVPVRHTFRKQLRVVRDVARELGKNVELKLEGEETEVDKSVVEALNDPLVHIIRNAVDHGMEDPEERLATGKPEQGVVTLTAIHQSGEVWITVQDDGRGLDREKILAKAKERGVAGLDTAQMSDRDVFNLLFAPGFSTATKVTKISGRGVGLDVARRNIEQLGGRVDIDSILGEGTTFTLRIPLTLAIIEGMLVRVGTSKYTVPLLNVRETVRVSSDALVTLPSGQEVVHIRDQIFSLVRLHEIHHIQPDSRSIEEGLILVLESSGERYCLFVDDVLGQFQTVIKSLGEYLQEIRGISGCTILGTGEVSLILDTAEMRRLACIERTKGAGACARRSVSQAASA